MKYELLMLSDVLYSIYFIRGGQMEILKNNESQAILGRNDTLGENPCNTMTPGKSRCVVRGLTYCTLNKIHRDDLLHVFQLYPDFAQSFAERFRVTFDLRQCELNESKPFYELDDEIQTLIRQRRPKLQTDRQLSLLSQHEEANRLAALRSYHGVRMSLDGGRRRPISTTVELSPDQANTSSEDLQFSQKASRMSLTPLAYGTLTNVFSTIVAMSKRAKTNIVTFQEEEEQEQENLPRTTETNFVTEKTKSMQKYETGPIRSMADVDSELSLLQRRFDCLERTMDDKMKLLFDFANNISITNNNHQFNNLNQTNDTKDNKYLFGN
ncbi:unnamed protein product [Rotaria sp. Silwood1]|nr:unnamed protein product [Rotaria sp. Silwood1]